MCICIKIHAQIPTHTRVYVFAHAVGVRKYAWMFRTDASHIMKKGLIHDVQEMSFFQKLSSTSLIHTQEKDLHAAAKTPGRRVKR